MHVEQDEYIHLSLLILSHTVHTEVDEMYNQTLIIIDDDDSELKSYILQYLKYALL